VLQRRLDVRARRGKGSSMVGDVAPRSAAGRRRWAIMVGKSLHGARPAVRGG